MVYRLLICKSQTEGCIMIENERTKRSKRQRSMFSSHVTENSPREYAIVENLRETLMQTLCLHRFLEMREYDF